MSKQAKVGEKSKLRLCKPAKDWLVESWERYCNDGTVLSGWLVSSFLQHISWWVSVESVIDKQKSSCHFTWRNGSIAAWMFVHPTNMAVIFDLKGFLINQKLFLSTSEYHYHIINKNSKVYRLLENSPKKAHALIG